ncbi:MAG TPA: molybdopterin cofactor-binding domain-containing protein [Gemmatimonadaceae bacterium]|nr:molybdopterin cofactor-binding domain-containing protein [Gemmatimonadaceae bacterium]
MSTDTSERLFGASVNRREDARFLTGRGLYTDDVKMHGTTHAVFVRSPHAHARVRSIDAAAARAHAGVRAVFTGQDLATGGVQPLPVAWLLPNLKIGERRALVTDVVRYAGEAVAVVIADTLQAADDAAELVNVDYEVLPAVVDAERAIGGAVAVHPGAPDNVAFEWTIGDAEATNAAFAKADRVVKQRLLNRRLIANAIEPRATHASYSPASDEYTVYVTSQNPHVHRLLMAAFVLGIPEHKLRVIAPDVGGAFGSKIFVYPEEVVAAWASKAIGRPVKWTAERRESFLTDMHGRDHVTDAEIALDADGRILGLRVDTIANLGAHVSLFGPSVPTYLYATLLSGQYTIGAIHCRVRGVHTHTTPVDAYRGAGRPEACFVVERMVDLAAKELGIDPVEIRRRNFIAPDQFPYQTPVALTYDSGNYPVAMQRALEMAGYDALRTEQAEARRQGRYMGIGISSYIEACGLAPSQVAGALGAQAGLWESATVRVHPTGKVTVFTGSHSHGQGHETTFAQVAADALGIAMDDVEVVHGDTGRVPFGMGSYGSRSGAVGGSAIHMSIEKLKEKGKRLAAHLLEAAPEDMEFEGGKFFVRGSPDRTKGFAEIALAAYLAHSMPAGMEPGLDATSFYDPSNFTYPFGTHIAVVDIDGDTGKPTLRRYIAVDDVGNVINPKIVDGQLHGGIVQGIAQALWECAIYDDQGQLLTGSLMEYGVPKADQLPSFETDRTVTPSPVNPLGVKGAGEAGSIAAPAAVANAVIDALAPFGVRHLDMPLTPATIWQAMQGAPGR